MDASGAQWALALFRRSVLKQEKFARIVDMLGSVEGKTCLDIGGDNGIISYLLRRRGGTWHSADLDPTTVESIRELVGSDVHLIDGVRTPFPDRFFDVVVIVTSSSTSTPIGSSRRSSRGFSDRKACSSSTCLM